jgi:hypothetical protein
LDDAWQLLASGVVGGILRSTALVIGVPRLAITFADELPLFGIGHDHPLPTLAVAAGGRLQRDLETFQQQLAWDRSLQVESLSDRARGRKEFVRRHGA